MSSEVTVVLLGGLVGRVPLEWLQAAMRPTTNPTDKRERDESEVIGISR